MNEKILKDVIPHNGLSFEGYSNMMINKLAASNIQLAEGKEKEDLELIKLNIQRTTRILKTYTVSDELKAALSKIETGQVWMAITELWCGDSAQNLPYIAKMAEVNPNITLKLILRDSNPEVMDEYLTNGTRSIPIVIAFDLDGNELFKWGPRPAAGQEIVTRLKAEGKTKTEFLHQLHLWYSKNKGAELEKEILEKIKTVI